MPLVIVPGLHVESVFVLSAECSSYITGYIIGNTATKTYAGLCN